MEQNFPAIIIGSDSIVREGLRLILADTPFHTDYFGNSLEEIGDIPDDAPAIFLRIVGQGDQYADQIADIRDRYPLAKVVIVAKDDHAECLNEALEAGANAALLTSITAEGLIKTLQALASDELMVVDAKLWATVFAQRGPLAGPSNNHIEEQASLTHRQLSAREVEILDRIVLGDSNKHIARHFDIAEATVKAHLKAILRKIGVNNRTSAAIWAVNNRLSDMPDVIAKEDESSLDTRRSPFEHINGRAYISIRSPSELSAN